MIYMPAGRLVWREVAKEFERNGVAPKIWLGDPKYDEFAKANFPECEVLSFFEVQKEVFPISQKNKEQCILSLDRSFYMLKDQVYKMMDRQDDLGFYGRLERESMFYSMFFYFTKLVRQKKVTMLVASEGPHSPAGMVLYGVARMLGLPTYHLAQNSIIPVAHIAKDFNGAKITLKNSYINGRHEALVDDYVRRVFTVALEPYYMTLQKEYDFKKNRLLSRVAKSLRGIVKGIRTCGSSDGYGVYSKTYFKENKKPLLFNDQVSKRIAVLQSSYQHAVESFDFSIPFVYVPLHYEPERTSNPDGGEFYNVYDMLFCLRKLIPLDTPLVIKEHYSQFSKKLYGYRGRSPLFYESVKGLGNVVFVDVNVPSSRLIRECLFVATQTGSAALEAAILEKKSVVFGAPWFLGTPNIYAYKTVSSFTELIESEPHSKTEVADFLKSYLRSYCIPGLVNPSGEKYFKKVFSDSFDELLNESVFVSAFVKNICNDYKRLSSC